jgi:hypothetical protein
LKIISDPAMYTAMATASVVRYHSHLTWDAFGEKLYGILCDICGGRGSSE